MGKEGLSILPRAQVQKEPWEALGCNVNTNMSGTVTRLEGGLVRKNHLPCTLKKLNLSPKSVWHPQSQSWGMSEAEGSLSSLASLSSLIGELWANERPCLTGFLSMPHHGSPLVLRGMRVRQYGNT